MPVAPRAARWGLAAVAVVGSAAISLQSTGSACYAGERAFAGAARGRPGGNEVAGVLKLG